MNIILLFGIFPKNRYSEIVENSKGVIQYAADALQKSIIEGIGSLADNIEILNLPYIGSYPKRYNKFWSINGNFAYVTRNGNIVRGENERFCNLSGFKLISRYWKTKKALFRWCRENKEENKIVIIYAIHTPFLKACIDIKEKYYPSLKVVLIVPDLPEYMGGKSNRIMDFFRDKNEKILSSLYQKVDGYVLLSKYMADYLHLNIKWTVIEGIFNNVSDDILVDKTRNSEVKYIFYSGTLARRYGILNLVKAFTQLSNSQYRLVICGDGDSVDEIREYIKQDNRIIYKGQLPREVVLKLQRKATLLINPRTPEGEFTKYSFPSKTMEYLASGVPTLLYKLPGIPDEYYQYCYSLEDTSINALSKKIEEILAKDEYELMDMGKRARNFILKEKNPIAQCRKIINLINSL